MTSPRKPNRTRPKQIILWATEAEHRALKAAAKRSGLGVGPWLRMLGLSAAQGSSPWRPTTQTAPGKRSAT